jgi:hypothetical protein
VTPPVGLRLARAVGIFPALLEYLGLKCPARLNRILPTRWVS